MTFTQAGLSGVGLLVLALGGPNARAEQTFREPGYLSAPGSAQQGNGPTADPVAERPTPVSDALKLALKFSDIPRLNGDYRINADDTITVPGLGRITVSGITIRQLEEALREKATGIAGREIFVTVEVSEYRPVFITGSVARSGPLPWQPGLTVNQAIATVGGIAQSQTVDTIIQRRKAEIDQQRLIAAMARLTAEQQGASRIEMPPELTKLIGARQAEQLIEAQSTMMRNRQISLQKQLDALALGKSLANQELESLRVQRARLEDQLQLRRKQRDRIQSLLDQKLTVVDRALEENIKVSDLEEKAANISVAIARVQATLTNFDRDALNLSEQRKSDVDSEFIRIERELANMRAVLDLTATSKSADSETENEEVSSIRYMISRRAANAVQSIEASQSSVLWPGDVLMISLAAPPVR